MPSSAPYHKYIFDDRRMIGDFEGMYAAENIEGFDGWHATDMRHLRMRLVQELLSDYNFPHVLDVGCGKGTQTQFLKKKNNRVVGIDCSPTAVNKAKTVFPDIEFINMDATQIETLGRGIFSLITFQAMLSYVPTWDKVLRSAARIGDHCLVAEYIPRDPKGAIKSSWDLIQQFSMSFNIIHEIVLDQEFIILFGKVK